MPVEKKYEARTDLPAEWEWGLIMDIVDLLAGRGFELADISHTDEEGTNSTARNLDDMIREFPDPLAHDTFSVVMSGDQMQVDVWSSPAFGSAYVTVGGPDQAQVLGLAEVLRRLVEKWEPHDDEPSLPDPVLPTVTSTKEVIPEMPSDPLWKQPWFWGAMTVLVAVITLAVIIVS